jgi:hypothetical protein
MFWLDDEVSWAGIIGYVDSYVDDIFPVKPVVYATCIVVVWYINVLNDVIVFLLYYRKR